MQTRKYDGKDGRRVWLNRAEQKTLVEHYREEPRKALTVRLGLSGLRSEEIASVAREDVRAVDGDGAWKLSIPQAKRGARETPLPGETRDLLVTTANARGVPKDQPVIDRSTKQIQRWVKSAAESIRQNTAIDDWQYVRPHDLRRTWATDTYYTLAFHGVPIAEQLVMGWGGWAMTESGRKTFRQNYLGPEPDHIAEQAMETAGLL